MKLSSRQFINEKTREIKHRVKVGKVVSFLSGGVDSSATTMLAYGAIKDQLGIYFIDTGLMRENEPREVIDIFGDLGIKVELIEAEDRFFRDLEGIEDGEEKRKVVRKDYFDIIGETAREIGAIYFFQGTNKLDKVETDKGFKTQHNIVNKDIVEGLRRSYGIEEIIEPLEDLYKNQIRIIARELELPKEICERQPFPGPGLAVRIIGEITRERVGIARRADSIVREEIENAYKRGKIPSLPFQYFVVLLKDRATRTTEEPGRNYGNVMVVRSVESVDASTAKATELPYGVLNRIEEIITTEIPSVCKVIYDRSSKPPSTIEWI